MWKLGIHLRSGRPPDARVWLAVNIIVCVLAITYVLDPTIFQELLRQGVEEGVNQLN